MARINLDKFAKFVHLQHSRSKTINLLIYFEKTISNHQSTEKRFLAVSAVLCSLSFWL